MVSVILPRLARVTFLLAGLILFFIGGNLAAVVPVATAIAPTATPWPYSVYLPAVMTSFPLPPAVTPSPLPTKPPAGSSGLDFVNYYRATARLPGVTDEPTWSAGDADHARYAVKNDLLTHTEDPANRWYTVAGAAAAGASNQIGSWDVTASDEWAVDTWMAAVFHAVGILDPGLLQSGYGSYREAGGSLQMAAALDVIRGLGSVPAGVSFPFPWPGDGMTVQLRQLANETPNPLTSCPGYAAPAGLPVVLIFGGGDPAPVVTSHSFAQGGTPLEHCVFDGINYVNPDAGWQSLGRSILRSRNAIVLMPRVPLTPGASYTASITANSTVYQWTFSVAQTAVLAIASEPPAMAAPVVLPPPDIGGIPH